MKYIIEIPKPCSENWERMSPTEKGRHCFSCQKEVIDFRNLSNYELAKYVSKNSNACGRFTSSQLNQEITLVKTKNRFSIKLFLLGLSSLTLGVQTYSQDLKEKIENTNDKQDLKPDNKKIIVINGLVADNLGSLPGANVIEKNTNNATQTDINGIFKIQIPYQNFGNRVYLSIEYIGMETQVIEVFEDSKEIKVTLKGSETIIGEVVVTGGYKAKKQTFFRSFINLFKRKKTCH